MLLFSDFTPPTSHAPSGHRTSAEEVSGSVWVWVRFSGALSFRGGLFCRAASPARKLWPFGPLGPNRAGSMGERGQGVLSRDAWVTVLNIPVIIVRHRDSCSQHPASAFS